MAKIYLLTFKDKDVLNGTVMVSHGIHEETLENFVMDQQPLSYYVSCCGAKRDDQGEYYILTSEPDKDVN